MRRPAVGTESVRNLLVQLLSEMQPEILARRVRLDLDLDDVQMDSGDHDTPMSSRPKVIAAMRGLLADAIESTGHEGELSVTLIDADSSWELELATATRNRPAVAGDSPGNKSPSATNEPNPADNVRIHRLAGGWRGKNFTLSTQAANQCGGQIQILECPQGGAARVLVMPKRQLRSAV